MAEKGIVKPKRQAEEVIADALSLRRIDLFLQFERPLMQDEIALCRSYLQRRARGEPIQYIRGSVDFFGTHLKLTPAVLIPRPETEILVDKIFSFLKKIDLSGKILWDMCTGSGCMGIALKKKFPELEVVLSDISSDAIYLAQENAMNNGVEVRCFQGDLFEPFKDRLCDFFVCNPPYVSEKEFSLLDREVTGYEPKIALLGGIDGLDFYRRIAGSLFHYFRPQSKAWFEIGSNQKEKILPMFQKTGFKLFFEKDWSGKDRFFFLERD